MAWTDQFKVDDRADCERACKNGAVAAFISAGITGAFALAGFYITPSDPDLASIVDPAVLFDAAFVFVLGLFVLRKSRVAAVLLLLYFAASKLTMWVESGKPSGLPLALLFFAYFFTAARATFVWRRLKDGPGAAPATARALG